MIGRLRCVLNVFWSGNARRSCMSNVYWLCVHPEACILELECRERVETCVHVYWSGNDRRSCVVQGACHVRDKIFAS